VIYTTRVFQGTS